MEHGTRLTMDDKHLIKKIIALALKIKETEQLSKVSEELRTMEIENVYYKRWKVL